MPLFGSRMVCETANYKYIEKRDKKFAKRENVLRRWVNEKRERRARLRDLKEKIQKVNESKCKPCEGLQRSESVRSLRETISPRLVIFDQPHADNNNQQRYSESSPNSPVPGTEPTTPSPSTPAAMGNEDPRFNQFFTKPTATAASRRRSKRSSLRRDSKHGSIGFTHDINGHKLKAAIANNGGGNVTATASVVMAGNKRNGGKINCDELGASKNKLKKGMLSMVPSNKYARLEEESVISAQDSHRFSLSDSHQGFGLKEEKTTTCGSCTIL